MSIYNSEAGPVNTSVIAPAYVEPKKNKILSRLLRPAVSLGLLYLLLRGTDWNEFLSLAVDADFFVLSAGLALVVLAVLLSAYKWQRLLTVQQAGIPLAKLFEFYLVGLFFNNFLPTNIGGDVVRIHDAARYTGKTAESAGSVVAERLLAALALALTASAGLVFSYQLTGRFLPAVGGLFAVSLLFILIFAVEKWRRALGQWVKFPGLSGIRQRLSGFGTAMNASMRDWKNTAYVVVLSIGFHLIVVTVTYSIFISLGLNVPFGYCLLFVPIISAIQMLPISISGFGVREGAYVYFFGSAGLSSTEAIASSLIFWAVVALVSLIGGLIFALRR